MNSIARRGVWVLAAASLMATVGCATSGPRSEAPPPVEPAPGPIIDARQLRVVDGQTGGTIGWSSLVARACGADVVMVGELHGHPVGGAATVALVEDMIAAGSPGIGISLEFFDRDTQADIDDYLCGIADEKAFRERTRRVEGNYPDAHRSLVEIAREAGRPVTAANAPRRYATVARRDGFDRLQMLTADQQRLFAIPGYLTEGGYRDRFFALMAGMGASHGAPSDAPPDPKVEEAMIMGFYRAQNLWDSTMADSIARAHGSGQAPVVHVVGQFHCDFDGGLTQRVNARMPGARVLTVSLVDAPTWTEMDRGRADVVIVVGIGER